jgi:RNA polymerase sigma-70 factor (sigma-E family)
LSVKVRVVRGSVRDREFVEYVNARRPVLVRTAYLVCGDWHEAEDLVQVALVRLYGAWPRVRRDGREDAYVRRIVVNAHLDRLRWRARRREVLVREPFEPPGREAAKWDEPPAADRLRHALRELPPGRRAVVVLRFYVGLTVEETAGELGLAVGTVKSQCSRALASLRVALTEDEGSRT